MKKMLLFMLVLSVSVAQAKVMLPSLLGDNMVLQQRTSVKLWGKAAPGSSIRITPSWSGQTVRCQTDAQGRWLATIDTPQGGYTPYEIVFDDGEPLTLKNVLIGEVWLASGQSNMEQTLYRYEECPIENAEDEIINASSEKGIRMFNVPNIRKYEPQEECGGNWMVPGMDVAPRFSATAWFFAKSLTRALNVPVGMVVAAAGGSMIESWMERPQWKTIPIFRQIRKVLRRWLVGFARWDFITPCSIHSRTIVSRAFFGIRAVPMWASMTLMPNAWLIWSSCGDVT